MDKRGLKSVLVNGYVGSGTDGKGQYVDEPQCDPFWKALSELRVPLYLPPRAADKAAQEVLYRGHPGPLILARHGVLLPETATHALRMAYGGVSIGILAPRSFWDTWARRCPSLASRIQRAFEYNTYGKTPAKRLQDYLSGNLWVTTSGNVSDQALVTALLTVGSDRVLFATDSPFDMSTHAADWIERAPISERDRRRICFQNAEALFAIAPQQKIARITQRYDT